MTSNSSTTSEVWILDADNPLVPLPTLRSTHKSSQKSFFGGLPEFFCAVIDWFLVRVNGKFSFLVQKELNILLLIKMIDSLLPLMKMVQQISNWWKYSDPKYVPCIPFLIHPSRSPLFLLLHLRRPAFPWLPSSLFKFPSPTRPEHQDHLSKGGLLFSDFFCDVHVRLTFVFRLNSVPERIGNKLVNMILLLNLILLLYLKIILYIGKEEMD